MNWQWTSIDSIAQLHQYDFNQLVPLEASSEKTKTPFLSYAFLSNLEKANCVGENSGWLAQHIVIYTDDKLPSERLSASVFESDNIIAVIPAYIKTHSYGEYVFDHSWANAYQQHGLDYYPKLIMAIPFTPVTGARVLKGVGIETNALLHYITDIKKDLLQRLCVSSLHVLFPPASTSKVLAETGFNKRNSVQFNWHNKDYLTYNDFTAALTARRRRSIKKERQYCQTRC
jgi:predicted N-acyltransferase